MNTVEYQRVNGDELSVLFNNHGTLSTAFLTVDGERHDVSPMFPALNKDNIDAYLSRLGFRTKWKRSYLKTVKRWNRRMEGSGFLICDVTEDGGNLMGYVSLEQLRSDPYSITCMLVVIRRKEMLIVHEWEDGTAGKLIKHFADNRDVSVKFSPE